MFKLDLTTEEALRQVGPILDRAELRFDAEHPLVRENEAIRDQVARQLAEDGHLDVDDIGRFTSKTARGRAYLTAVSESMDNYTRIFNHKFDLLENISPWIFKVLEELFWNAMEHGTNYCEKGPITVWRVLGAEWSLIAIDEMASSVSASTLKGKTMGKTDRDDFSYTRASGRNGGCGFYQASMSGDVMVNFENIHGGLRTLVLEKHYYPDKGKGQLSPPLQRLVELRKWARKQDGDTLDLLKRVHLTPFQQLFVKGPYMYWHDELKGQFDLLSPSEKLQTELQVLEFLHGKAAALTQK